MELIPEFIDHDRIQATVPGGNMTEDKLTGVATCPLFI
jgi:hypothetical protein